MIFSCFLCSSVTYLPVSKFAAFAAQQLFRALYYQEDFLSAFLKFFSFLISSPLLLIRPANVTLNNSSGSLVEKYHLQRVKLCIGDSFL